MDKFISKTFLDVPNREWALETKEALFLKDVLPQQIWDNLKRLFLSTGLESSEAEIVLPYFLENSEITRSVKARPSSAMPFEYIYRKAKPLFEIDQYFVRSTGAIGIYLRLLTLRDVLPGIISKEIKKFALSKNGTFRILNVGSGPCHEMVEVLNDNPDLIEKVHVVAVDNDDRALNLGKKRAEDLGLSKTFTFVHKSLEEVYPMDAHFVLLIGMLCPVRSVACERILRGLLGHCHVEGLIVYSTVQEDMILGDPLLDVFMRGMGWQMDYKSNYEAERIGRASGWTVEDYFCDALGFNRMTIARANDGSIPKSQSHTQAP